MPRHRSYKPKRPGAASKPGKALIKAGSSKGSRGRRPGGPAIKPSAKPKVVDH